MQFLPGSGRIDTAIKMHYLDANKTAGEKLDGNYTTMLLAILNNPQSTNYTATNILSRKLSKLDEPDMQDTAGEAKTSS